MTKKLFWENPYKTSLDTFVERVESSSVFLRKTEMPAFQEPGE